MAHRIVKIGGFIVGALFVLVVGVLAAARLTMPSRQEVAVGPVAGALRTCPDTPNCISSLDDRTDSRVPSITYSGDAALVMERAGAVLRSFGNVTIVEERDDYIHAEARSSLFGFVDDVELHLDDESSVLHFRSASRAGHSDLGVNRERYEAFREAFSTY